MKPLENTSKTPLLAGIEADGQDDSCAMATDPTEGLPEAHFPKRSHGDI